MRPSSGATSIKPAAYGILINLLWSGGVSSGGVRRVVAEGVAARRWALAPKHVEVLLHLH
jgi:hypothetical protein